MYEDDLEYNEDEEIFYGYGEGFEEDLNTDKEKDIEVEEEVNETMNENETSFTALNKTTVSTEELNDYLNN